jgi:hypothetical protein
MIRMKMVKSYRIRVFPRSSPLKSILPMNRRGRFHKVRGTVITWDTHPLAAPRISKMPSRGLWGQQRWPTNRFCWGY